jgi:heterodisulfide reductase subunit A
VCQSCAQAAQHSGLDRAPDFNRGAAGHNFHEEVHRMPQDVIGSVMVVGGGIAGMQAALDLANSGYYVYLLEKSPSIGGVMSQLDKTFPTNDCAM